MFLTRRRREFFTILVILFLLSNTNCGDVRSVSHSRKEFDSESLMILVVLCLSSRSCPKTELCNQKTNDQPENSGVMSLARWFRELRGKSSGKETAGVENSSAKSSKTKDERRVKLNRTNSALPANFRKSVVDEDVVDGPGICNSGGKRERKIKGVDKRRYSFNGNSSNAKLARNPR